MKKTFKYLSSLFFILISLVFVFQQSLADMLPPGNFESVPKELRKGFFEIVTFRYVLIGIIVVISTIFSFYLMAKIRDGEKLFSESKKNKDEGSNDNLFFTKFGVFALMVVAGIAAGSIPTATKIAMGNNLMNTLSPFSIMFFRYVIALFCLLLIVIERKELSLENFKNNFIPSFFAILNPLALFYALKLGSKASVSILIYAIGPVLTALYFVVFENKKLTNKHLTGILVGFIGVILVMFQSVFAKGEVGSLEGNLLSFLATIFFVTYAITSGKKQKENKVSPYSLVFYSSVIAVVFSLFPALENIKKVDLAMNQFLALAWLGVVSTVLFFLVFQYIIKKNGVLVASVYAYLQATLGAIVGVVVLKEKMSVLIIFGAILTFIGAKISSNVGKEKEGEVKKIARKKPMIRSSKKVAAKKTVVKSVANKNKTSNRVEKKSDKN